MSFTENPYTHVQFFVRDDGQVEVECSSCGGTSQAFPGWTPALELLDYQRDHVATSHRRSEDDFRGWR